MDVGRQKSRHSFTLLEILVALVVLSLASGFVAIKAFDLIDSYKKEQTISLLQSKIRFYSSVAMYYQGEVYMQLEQEKDTVILKPVCYEAPKAPKLLFKEIALHHLLINENIKEIILYADGRVEPHSLLLQWKDHPLEVRF